MKKILITGSEGLIGNRIRRDLVTAGYEVVGLDTKACTYGAGVQADILDAENLEKTARDCHGIIHLAAVSRVIYGEKDPELCKEVNINGTNNVISAARKSPNNPWIIYASSREVYGEAETLPVSEDFALKPLNVYGRTKAIAEENICRHLEKSQAAGAILRFSNVYGDVVYDHADRVVPAFARCAAYGDDLRVDGKDNSFDFTHLLDTADGIMKTVQKLDSGKSLPPIHFLTGRQTTLDELSKLSCALGSGRSKIIEAPSRNYDVSQFYGSPQRAKDLLDWQPTILIDEGIKMMVQDYKGLLKAA